MTGAPGFLEFFILEASEYVEQLDGLLLGAGVNGPDAESMQRVARALRGAATMAKLTAFAELASGVERMARAIQEGVLSWEPSLGGVLVATIDDLKTLLHSARGWSAADEQRAQARSAELARFAPVRATPSRNATVGDGGAGSSYLATEAANVAAGLELLVTRAGDAETAGNVLRRVRALRGVAGVKEVAPLAEVLEATEDAARDLELGQETLSVEARRLFESAATYLRALSVTLRDGSLAAPPAAREAFVAALSAWSARESERDRVVPIETLFYADGTPGLVESAANPPTTARERFRLELVSLGEHLRQVVDAARGAPARDADAVARARRDLRRALHAIETAAESFARADIVELAHQHHDAAEHVDFLGLAALDTLANVLMDAGEQDERLAAHLRDSAGFRALATALGAGFGTEAVVGADLLVSLPVGNAIETAPASSPAAQPPRPARVSVPEAAAAPPFRPSASPRITPVRTASLDAATVALIDSSIEAIERLSDEPFSAPVPIPEDTIVPIESLLYRGRAALDRALVLRDEVRGELRERGATGGSPALEELFDLLELARAE